MTTPPPDQRVRLSIARRFATTNARRRVAVIKGQDVSRFTDVYHAVLTAPWWLFLFEIAALFATVNAIFGLLYSADTTGILHARPGSFWDMYVFSVQIIGGVTFSDMTPRSAYIDIVVVIEALVGILFLGIVAATMFARLSRPTARVIFSNVAVVVPFNGVPTLMFRAANQRGNQVLDASVNVSLALQIVTTEGIEMRRFQELELVRSRTPLFALSWTVMHPIDEKSPLYGLDVNAMFEREIEVIILLSGRDETLADIIYARHAYTPDQIVWNHRFVDVIKEEPEGHFSLDLHQFHDTVPAPHIPMI